MAEPVGFASTAGAIAHVFAVALDDQIVIEGADGHHLQRVRRLRIGERVTVADGRGRWRAYVVTASDRGTVGLEPDGPTTVEPRCTPGLASAFALTKGAKPETVVSALTELGVDRIVPFRSARSVTRWDEERAASATLRLRRVAREAAIQCRRATMPIVEAPTDVASVARAPGVVIGDPDGVTLAEVPIPAGGEWTAVVGAEGGLDPDERAFFAAGESVCMLAVGPHVLRAETAAVAVAAALTTRRVHESGHGA